MRIRTLAVVFALGVAGVAAGQIRMQGLGPTAFGDIRETAPVALSADGSTIVSSLDGRALRWRESEGWRQLQPLPANGGRSATASGVSANGRFIVGTSNSATVPGAAEAVIWDELGEPLGLGDLSGGSFDSFGLSVSSDGAVVIGSGSGQTSGRIFRWVRGAGMQDLGGQTGAHSGFDDTHAAFCSANGSIVFGRTDQPNLPPARWNGSWASLGDLPGGGRFGWVRGISPSGNYAVGESSAAEGTLAYMWSADRGMEWLGMNPLGFPGGTQAFAVSEGGAIVVGSAPTGWVSQAAIWDPAHGWRNLKLLLLTEYNIPEADAWTMQIALAVSADGRTVAGLGINPCGRQDIWVVRLIPQGDPCAADFNADGFLDFFDFDAFTSAFELGLPAADFNKDCFVDFFDFGAFVEAFEAGC